MLLVMPGRPLTERRKKSRMRRRCGGDEAEGVDASSRAECELARTAGAGAAGGGADMAAAGVRIV
jgi:hypothetical protein